MNNQQKKQQQLQQQQQQQKSNVISFESDTDSDYSMGDSSEFSDCCSFDSVRFEQPKRKVSFQNAVDVAYTYEKEQYDRTYNPAERNEQDVENIVHQLTMFKINEMNVHPRSQIFTNYHANERRRRSYQQDKVSLLRKKSFLEDCDEDGNDSLGIMQFREIVKAEEEQFNQQYS
eukprot:Pgem_evm1s9774